MESADFEEEMARIPPRRGWLIGIGKACRFVLIVGTALVIAFNIPAIGGTPFAQLTPNDLFFAVFLIAMAGLCVKWAFADTTDEAAEGWAAWTAVLLIGAAGLIYYLAS